MSSVFLVMVFLEWLVLFLLNREANKSSMRIGFGNECCTGGRQAGSLVFNRSVKYEAQKNSVLSVARAPTQSSAEVTPVPHNYFYAQGLVAVDGILI
jgi:hypothetical protein